MLTMLLGKREAKWEKGEYCDKNVLKVGKNDRVNVTCQSGRGNPCAYGIIWNLKKN